MEIVKRQIVKRQIHRLEERAEGGGGTPSTECQYYNSDIHKSYFIALSHTQVTHPMLWKHQVFHQ